MRAVIGLTGASAVRSPPFSPACYRSRLSCVLDCQFSKPATIAEGEEGEEEKEPAPGSEESYEDEDATDEDDEEIMPAERPRLTHTDSHALYGPGGRRREGA